MAAFKAVHELLKQTVENAEDNKKTLAVIGGVTAVAGLAWFVTRSKPGQKTKPGTFDIGSGAVDRSKVQDEVRKCGDASQCATNYQSHLFYECNDARSECFMQKFSFQPPSSSTNNNSSSSYSYSFSSLLSSPLLLLTHTGQGLLRRVQHLAERRRCSAGPQRKSGRPRR